MDDFMGNPEIRDLPLSLKSCRDQVDAFLAPFGLRRQPMDYYAGVFVGDRMLAGGGFSGSVIQCVAAAEEARGLGLMSVLMTHLRQLLGARGVRNSFVFTKPENREIFRSLAFTPIGAAPEAILLESDRHGVSRFVDSLRAGLPESQAPGPVDTPMGCVVMNANPFTLGHQHLAEQAAARCGQLLVLVVAEERSAFPFAARLALCRRGCAHLPNVTVMGGGPYVISGQTFPSYFLKEMSRVVETHAALDADLFARHIAPPLGIAARFVGEEPQDAVTAAYNAALGHRLPQSGITLHTLPRREMDGQPISASRVRALMAAGRARETARLVPGSTYAYIVAHLSELTS